MRLAPIGAYGTMTFAVSKYGLGSALVLGKLMMAVYVTCAMFVFVVLNAIARLKRLGCSAPTASWWRRAP